MKHFKKTLRKIAQFAYTWIDNDAGADVIKLPDGLSADSHYSLADVLEDARASKIITKQESDMLSHIIPCCRKDKSKRDFIEVLLA